MNCPKCNAETGITDTRPTGEGTVRRRHVCKDPKCKHAFSTIELPLEQYNLWQKLLSNMRKLTPLLSQTGELVSKTTPRTVVKSHE
jgi:hypothetical protein